MVAVRDRSLIKAKTSFRTERNKPFKLKLHKKLKSLRVFCFELQFILGTFILYSLIKSKN